MSDEFQPLTPVQIEQQLRLLSRRLEESQKEAERVEGAYGHAVYEFEKKKARLVLELKAGTEKFTVAETEATVLIEADVERWAVVEAEIAKNINRTNIQKLRTQSELARSVAVSVRTSMGMAE